MGRPKGSKNKKTLKKEKEERRVARQQAKLESTNPPIPLASEATPTPFNGGAINAGIDYTKYTMDEREERAALNAISANDRTQEERERLIILNTKATMASLGLAKIKDVKSYEYWIALLDGFADEVFSHLDRNQVIPTESKIGRFRYTPWEMAEKSLSYIRFALGNNQAPLVNGIAISIGMTRNQIFNLRKMADTPYAFLDDVVSFVEMYYEYSMLDKPNPAGPIFGLKNFGWKDRLDINVQPDMELTDEDRQSMRDRVKSFSEKPIIPIETVPGIIPTMKSR